MRKVDVTKYVQGKGLMKDEPPAPAYFHQFTSDGEPWAIVEYLDGSLDAVALSRIRFIEPPHETAAPPLQERINRLAAGEVPGDTPGRLVDVEIALFITKAADNVRPIR